MIKAHNPLNDTLLPVNCILSSVFKFIPPKRSNKFEFSQLQTSLQQLYTKPIDFNVRAWLLTVTCGLLHRQIAELAPVDREYEVNVATPHKSTSILAKSLLLYTIHLMKQGSSW
jgi:hypothetical protein